MPKLRKKVRRKGTLTADGITEISGDKMEQLAIAKPKKKVRKRIARVVEAIQQPHSKEEALTESLASNGVSGGVADQENGCCLKRRIKRANVSAKHRHDAKRIALDSLAGDAASYRNSHDIVVNDGCPVPLETFEAAEPHLGAALVAALRSQGYVAPTPIQAQAWPIAFQGHDVVGIAKTGSGKTCAYLLPALARIRELGATPEVVSNTQSKFIRKRGAARPRVLVITPTRELAQQVYGEAKKFSMVVAARVVVLYGGVSIDPQIRNLNSGADVIIATPGRLHECIAGDPSQNVKPSVALDAVSFLVLDEADKMLDMGFLQDIRRLVKKCPNSGSIDDARAGHARQTLFFTATWPEDVHQAASLFTGSSSVQLRIGQGTEISRPTANADVFQIVRVIDEDSKFDELKDIILNTMQPGDTAIVFANRKKTCDFLEQELSWDPRSVKMPICAWCKTIHGDREQWEREETLQEFRTMTAAGKYKQKGVLVATDVAARGLDIPGVALVVIYDFADSNGRDTGVQAYVHRIGRVGRAGKQGMAITFFTPRDKGAHELVALLRQAEQEVPPELASKGKGKGKGKFKGKGKGKSMFKGKGRR